MFLLAGSVHEWAHAWAASKLGDDTAERQGRLTLNPIAHADPLGLLVLAFSAMVGFGFGWMRPVPVSPWNLRNSKRDLMLISFAGPLSNIVQAILWLVAWILVLKFAPALASAPGVQTVFNIAIMLNLILAAFNLLPIQPLDGFAVAVGLLPQRASLRFEEFMGRYGPLILIAIFLIGPVRQVTLYPLYAGIGALVHSVAGFLTAML